MPTARRVMKPAAERLIWLVTLAGYMIVAYNVIARLNLGRTDYLDVALPFEADIPMVPEAVYAYAFVYVVIVVGALSIPIDHIDEFRLSGRWIAVNLTIAFVCFLLFPVYAEHRPEVPPSDELTLQIVSFYFFVDPPTNLFPSLHVQMSVLGGVLCWRRGPALKLFGLACAVVIPISVVLVKQHYIADIVFALVIVGVTGRVMGAWPMRDDDPVKGERGPGSGLMD